MRTSLGAPVSRRPPRQVTSVLIGVNVVLFGVAFLGEAVLARYGMTPLAVAAGEWWRLGTATFLHLSLWHLGFNMLALWILGGIVEPLLGHSRFLTIYLTSALGGAVASYVFSPPGTLSIGASGAVFGLLGATVVALRKLNRDVTGVMVLLGINVALGFIIPNIDWRAHLGGLVVGIVVTAAMVYAPARLRPAVSWGAVAAVLAVLGVVAGWRTDQLLQAFA